MKKQEKTEKKPTLPNKFSLNVSMTIDVSFKDGRVDSINSSQSYDGSDLPVGIVEEAFKNAYIDLIEKRVTHGPQSKISEALGNTPKEAELEQNTPDVELPKEGA